MNQVDKLSGHCRPNTLTIAICTYNRAEFLRDLLGNLVQVFNAIPGRIGGLCDVLVIDNNSADHTGNVLGEFESLLPVTAVREERPGLSNARNRALSRFVGDAILFLDDDVSIHPNTLIVYHRALEQFPQIDYFGGPIEVDWQDNRPRWLKSDDLVLLNGLFGKYQPASQDLEYRADVMGPYGANFLLRRRLVDQIGDFNSNLGVKGETPGRGEETDFFERARKLGARGFYLHKALVRHRFQLERLNLQYLYRYGIAKGQATGIPPAGYSGRLAISFLFRGLWQLVCGRIDRFYQCVINLGIIHGQSKGSQLVRPGDRESR